MSIEARLQITTTTTAVALLTMCKQGHTRMIGGRALVPNMRKNIFEKKNEKKIFKNRTEMGPYIVGRGPTQQEASS